LILFFLEQKPLILCQIKETAPIYSAIQYLQGFEPCFFLKNLTFRLTLSKYAIIIKCRKVVDIGAEC